MIKKTKTVKKVSVKKTVKVKHVEPVVEETIPTPVPEQPAQPESAKSRVVFEGIEVESVCEDGHTNEFYLCKMTDGTTRHVPKALIDN